MIGQARKAQWGIEAHDMFLSWRISMEMYETGHYAIVLLVFQNLWIALSKMNLWCLTEY